MTQPHPRPCQPLTERQRFWLGHLQAAEQAGLCPKAYAEREGLSLPALYAARAILRKQGALSPMDSAPVSFAAVQVAAPRPAVVAVTVHLPNGVRLEVPSALSAAGFGELLRWAAQLP